MPEMTRFALRLPAELYAAIQRLAERDRRSINGEIAYILERYVAEQEGAERRGRRDEDTPKE